MLRLIGYFIMGVVTVVVGNFLYRKINSDMSAHIKKKANEELEKNKTPVSAWKQVTSYPNWEMAQSVEGWVVRKVGELEESFVKTMKEVRDFCQSQQESHQA